MSFTPSFLVNYKQLENVFENIHSSFIDENIQGWLGYDMIKDGYNIVFIKDTEYLIIKNQTNYKYTTLKEFFIENKIEFYQFGC